ncbi:MAG TPA: hypothetical protein VE870_13385 [Bacteroidales bacterium]|nr:hypothetical protein [Bacteroidales bacterium]
MTIHYSGRFKEGASLSKMIREVQDVAEANNWKFHVFNPEFPHDIPPGVDKNLYGIIFSPPECEPVCLTFLSNKRMTGPTQVEHFLEAPNEEERKFAYMLFTKTQYAGTDIHKRIIHLFKYLDKQYFDEFEVHDEGKYWETGDSHILEKTYRKYCNAIDSFNDALQNLPNKEGENLEEYLMRLARMVNKGKKD